MAPKTQTAAHPGKTDEISAKLAKVQVDTSWIEKHHAAAVAELEEDEGNSKPWEEDDSSGFVNATNGYPWVI